VSASSADNAVQLLHEHQYSKINVVHKFNESDREKYFSLVHWYIHEVRDGDIDSTFSAKLGFISVDT
jgi:hypothetical protein